jgi:hypothetical protein
VLAHRAAPRWDEWYLEPVGGVLLAAESAGGGVFHLPKDRQTNVTPTAPPPRPRALFSLLLRNGHRATTHQERPSGSHAAQPDEHVPQRDGAPWALRDDLHAAEYLRRSNSD